MTSAPGPKEDSGLGSLYDYGARFYSPYLARFLSADSIVPKPEDPQDFNRYSYVKNNPLRYTDPNGHLTDDEIDQWAGYTAEWLKNNQYLIYQFLRELHFGDFLRWTGNDSSSLSLGTAGLANGRLVFKNGEVLGHNTTAGPGEFGISDLIDMLDDPGSHLPVAGTWNKSEFDLLRYANTGASNPLRFQLGKMADGTKWAAWGVSPKVIKEGDTTAGVNVGRVIVGTLVIGGTTTALAGICAASGGTGCGAMALTADIAAWVVMSLQTDAPGWQQGDRSLRYEYSNGVVEETYIRGDSIYGPWLQK